MGISIRKSIKAGPFRFNLSGSGIGVSVGVPGFRIGTGPRGNYVHMGRGGLYYRVSLPPTHKNDVTSVTPRGGSSPARLRTENFERIESASVLAMTDESAAGLLNQISEVAARQSTGPWAAAATIAMLVVLVGAGAPAWLTLAATAVAAGFAVWTHQRDLAGRAVVLFYDLEPDAQAAYEELHVAFARLAGAHGAWNVEGRAETDDRKRNAGATRLVQRQPVRLSIKAPEVIRTNIDVPAIPCGQETLHFFPDRLLVVSHQGVGAVPYDQLDLTVESWPFVEEGPVPSDASQIDTTWRYVNRDGGPDRRFADNRQLPILLYEQITFTSPTGLHEVLQLSITGGGLSFRSAIEKLGRLARMQPSDSRAPAGASADRRPSVAGSRDGMPAGRFEGEVSGDVDCKLGGRAVFGSRANERGVNIFYIVLRHSGREGEGEHSVTLSNALNGLPTPGRYTFGDMGPRTFVAGYSHETEGGSSGSDLLTQGGSLEIKSATADGVRGRIEFRAEGTNTYNLWAVQGHVRLQATFHAEPVEGDPYELSRLPGELRALAESDDPAAAIHDDEMQLSGSLDDFAEGVVEHLIVGVSLSQVLRLFADSGYPESAVRRTEALLFAALSFDALLNVGHFGSSTSAARSALRHALAERTAMFAGVSEDTMAGLVSTRLEEYADVVFNDDGLTVRDGGMVDLALRAYEHIIGGESPDDELLQALFTHFGSVSESLAYGERLAELYDLYLVHGEEIWDNDEAE